jgi:3-deoxy-manno-octulosonate cytidylyltransferase (CMP-KDO synthetase)
VKVLCVIPARFSSTRLPGKPLASIAGKPMIQHVYERAQKALRPEEVVVATDHELVYQAVKRFGGKAMMTSSSHATGTDRLAEVALHYTQAEIIINVQGDEPLIAPTVIDELADLFEQEPDLVMATLMTEMDEAEYENPAAVKVVTDLSGYALYFSRSLLPYPRNKHKDIKIFKHIGIYAYRREFLLTFASLAPTPLEQAECLEQLRALEHGYRIKVLKTNFKSIGVDTPEELAAINQLFAKTGGVTG